MTQNKQTQSTSANQKISTYLTMIVLIVMALAVTALVIAGETYLAGDQLAAGVLAGIGLIALVLSVISALPVETAVCTGKNRSPQSHDNH